MADASRVGRMRDVSATFAVDAVQPANYHPRALHFDSPGKINSCRNYLTN